MKMKGLKTFLVCLTVFALCAGYAGMLQAKGDGNVNGLDNALSEGKTYTVTYESPIENAFPKKAYKPEKKLTDGRFAANANYADSAFLELYRGTVASVTIDLEDVCLVGSVAVHGLGNRGAGIYAPRKISVAVSEDGESFGTVGSFEDKAANTSASPRLFNDVVELPEAYKARYVRVSIHCDVFLYLDEITVYGAAGADGGKAAQNDPEAKPLGYASPIDGIRSICLMYTVGHYQTSHLLPYIAYVDTEGKPVDTLYDGMIFLPSGASKYDFSEPSGWETYFVDLFGEDDGGNLAALNETVKTYGPELGWADDYRYPVFLAVHNFSEGSESFDGVWPRDLQSKLTIIKSLIDQMIRRFEDAGFDRLELKGFYWHEELLPYAECTYAEELVSGFTSYVHEKGYKATWIPYYCASGFERARVLGFDGPCLQAGYAFSRGNSETGDALPAACEDSAAQAYRYGLGIEFELDLNVSDYQKRFFKYVHTAYQTGCMTDGLMTMYQGVYDIYQCAKAGKGTAQRDVYEMLHQYTSKTFTSVAPMLEPGQVILAETNNRVNGSLAVTDPDTSKNSIKIKEREIQEGLNVVFEGDGFYLINTKDTAPGTYTVRLTLNDGYNLSKPEEVLVVVYDKAAERPSVTLDKDIGLYRTLTREPAEKGAGKGTAVTYLPIRGDAYYVFAGDEPLGIAFAEDLGLPSGDSDADRPGGETKSLWPLWVGIGAAALAAAAVAAILIIRKKKKKT